MTTAVVHRTGAERHLDVVDGAASDDGVLVPEALAAAAGVGPGDDLLLVADDGTAVPVPVSGVYAAPTEPLPAYWAAQSSLFLPRYAPPATELVPPPPAVLAPRSIALSVYAALHEDVLLEWSVPLRTPLAVPEARQVARGVDELQLRLADPGAGAGDLVRSENFADLLVRTALPDALAATDGTVELLAPPVRAVGIGGAGAALVLVGAWAGLRVRRRDDELRSLTARGLSPGRGALHAARESLLPGSLGLAAGGAAGWLLIRLVGPSPHLPAAAVQLGAALLAGALAAAVAVVAVVTAVLVTRLDQVGRSPAGALLGRVPWLPLTAVAAVLAALPLVTGSAAGNAGRIGVLPLLVPLLVTVVAAGAVTAVLPRIGRSGAARLRLLPPAGHLAVRRVLAGRGAARLLVATTALTLGLVVYAGALAGSTDRTVAAKASVATGSDVVVPVDRTSPAGAPLPRGAMIVGTDTAPVLVPGGIPADLLAVHPERVADVVRWDDSFADRPLPELMGALSGYEGDRVPVVVAGPLPDAALAATGGDLVLDFTYYSVPVEVVGRADAFPGQDSREPLVVADWDRYSAALADVSRVPELVVTREVWARGEAADALSTVAQAGYLPGDDVTSALEFATRPELDAQRWSLGYLRAVALAGGLLGLTGVVLFALSQQRRRTAASLLLTRMGMSRRAAGGATALEVGLLTGLAAVVAAAVALPASSLVLRALDPVPELRPDPLFAVPWADLAAVAGGVLLVTVASTLLVGRAARRVSGGQVLRDAP